MAQPSKTTAGRASASATAAQPTSAPTVSVSTRKAPAKRSPAKKAVAPTPSGDAGPGDPAGALVSDGPTASGDTAIVPSLKVREGESPWTLEELAEVRSELEEETDRLRGEIAVAQEDLTAMLRDAGDGAGDDQADAGSKTFEREHEMSLANNARDMLLQVGHALHRINDGTYGLCETCGNAIGKARLQAFPRATLCMTCKQREERR